MNILIVNDDGIEADGIARLAKFASAYGKVWVVAPEYQCSAMSQRITLMRKLIVKERPFPVETEGAYSVSGTPADCVKVALEYLMRKNKPDYIFSGINFGFNTGFDIAYSGTVGAAMEGIMKGIPSAAFSTQAVENYEVSERYLPDVMEMIFEIGPVLDGIWNVNFPGCSLEECKGILWERKVADVQYFQDHYEVTPLGDHAELTVQGKPLTVKDVPVGTDLAAVLNQYVSVGVVRCNVLENR